MNWENMGALEKDSLVAEKVMEWEWHMIEHLQGHPEPSVKVGWWPEGSDPGSDPEIMSSTLTSRKWKLTPHFSSSLEDSWKVLRRMKDDEYGFLIQNMFKDCLTVSIVSNDGTIRGVAKSSFDELPETICLAALRAKGVDV